MKKKYEKHLNTLYSENYSLAQIKDEFAYFNVKPSTIVKAYENNTLGTLFRNQDPQAFEVGFNTWIREGENK